MENILKTLNFVLPFIIVFLALYFVVDSLSPEGAKGRKQLLSSYTANMPEAKQNTLFLKFESFVDRLVLYMPNDSREKFTREMVRSLIMGFVVLISSVLMKQIMFGTFALYFLLVPILKRIFAKSDNKKKFKDDFFDAIFYLILFVSGGMSLQQAIIETTVLFDKGSPFRKALEEVIRNYNLTNENYVKLFELFERDYEIEEVSFFVNSMRISYTNGVGIRESLLNQLEYIRSNRNFYFKTLAGSFGNKLTPLMITFTMLPILIIMGLPPILESLSQMM